MKKIPNIEAFLQMKDMSRQAGCDEDIFASIRDKLKITKEFLDAYDKSNENGTRYPLVTDSFTGNAHLQFLENCRDNGVKTVLYAVSNEHTLKDLQELARYGATTQKMVAVDIDGRQVPAMKVKVN